MVQFGLCNALQIFRNDEQIFVDKFNSFILVYLEDISVYSCSVEEHWRHLCCALERLRTAKLYGCLHKCEFLKTLVDYLGLDISVDGIHSSPERVKSMVEWPTPQTVHDVRSFLELASYDRCFIRGFSHISRPLTDLTKAKVHWNWGDKEETSFEHRKATLASAPVMRIPDFERQSVVNTDPCDVSVGAILEQNFDKDGSHLHLHHASLTMWRLVILLMSVSCFGFFWHWDSGAIISKAHT